MHEQSVNCHVHMATSFYFLQFLTIICLQALLYMTVDKHTIAVVVALIGKKSMSLNTHLLRIQLY